MHTLANGAPLVTNIQEIFFAAQRVGYAADTPSRKIPGENNSKIIEFRQGRWRVVDTYWTNSYGNQSGGVTTIFYDSEAVWQMFYQGWYSESVIPFLKEALRANYRGNVFMGGRGPNPYRDTSKTRLYQNLPIGTFENFWGEESICDISETGKNPALGEHRYMGGLLVPVH